MNIKSILLASAAAMAVVSGAQAADAIVAAEPEPVEYVRVCDAYGTGYFYIPGTETCLKINGYIRLQVDVAPNASSISASGGGSVPNDSDWDARTRGQVQFTAKSDTEYGPLTGLVVIQTNADNATDQKAQLDSAYIDIAGFRAGLFYSWWDDGLTGETDDIGSPVTLHNSIRYQYETSEFYAGISVDELEDSPFYHGEAANNWGVGVAVAGRAGVFTYQVTAGYDTDNEEGAVRAMGTVPIGPGILSLAGIYSSNPNAYYNKAEWVVAGEYAVKATDKLKFTPAFQYYGHYGIVGDEFNDDNDAWKVGLTIDYQFVDNFAAKISLQYLDPDGAEDVTSGFLRLQRTF